MSGVVKVDFTHSVHPARVAEKRVQLSTTIGGLRAMAHTHFGTPPEAMRLLLKDETGAVRADLTELEDDSFTFGQFFPVDGNIVHVQDTDPNAHARVAEYTDVSNVEKYEISEEDYEKRTDTARAFMNELRKAGLAKQKEAEGDNNNNDVDLTGLVVGARCKVFPGDRLGTIAYVGPVPELPKGPVAWVGVALDEPSGKNDGTVKGGKRYFECAMNYGAFAKPEQVTVGDFPPEEY
eukprot:PhM_4_TR8848/c0_g1_i1/m.55976/K17262/TBCB, CKAP1, ALF1; tubulin-folding cofactor B